MTQAEETLEVTHLDQFMHLLVHWHENRMAQLAQIHEIPSDVEILVPDASGNDINLTEDQRIGFRAGISVARSLLQDLPFTMSETEPAQVE